MLAQHDRYQLVEMIGWYSRDYKPAVWCQLHHSDAIDNMLFYNYNNNNNFYEHFKM